jgi:hypothetical protein
MKKKTWLTFIACFICVVIFAQQEKENDTRVKKTVTKKNLDEPKVIDQRNEMHWDNGQKSTATGRQATAINGGYSALQPATKVKVVAPVNKTNRVNYTGKKISENRKIIMWENGQKSTTTGYEATGIGSGYSSLKPKNETLEDDKAKNKKLKEEQQEENKPG